MKKRNKIIITAVISLILIWLLFMVTLAVRSLPKLGKDIDSFMTETGKTLESMPQVPDEPEQTHQDYGHEAQQEPKALEHVATEDADTAPDQPDDDPNQIEEEKNPRKALETSNERFTDSVMKTNEVGNRMIPLKITRAKPNLFGFEMLPELPEEYNNAAPESRLVKEIWELCTKVMADLNVILQMGTLTEAVVNDGTMDDKIALAAVGDINRACEDADADIKKIEKKLEQLEYLKDKSNLIVVEED